VLGREDAAINFGDSGVSRRHAKLIVAADESVMIMDLGSTNQTLVNGTNVELATLSAGDRISLGPDVVLRFDYAAPPAEEPRAPIDAHILSARQWEVARLVARGLSNAEVARTLRISANTVSRHLENIYTRLGIGSRTALARWVLERDA
jgi:DNA-binding CsgD family transcriptional regulator